MHHKDTENTELRSGRKKLTAGIGNPKTFFKIRTPCSLVSLCYFFSSVSPLPLRDL
jgi:hypothetical protein